MKNRELEYPLTRTELWEIIIDDEQNANRILKADARLLQNEITSILQPENNLEDPKNSTPIEFTEEIFDGLYDPTLPTIVLTIGASFTGEGIVGVAEVNAENRKANIIYISLSINTGHYETGNDDKRHLIANYGCIIDKKGRTYYGEFPRAIRADLVVTSENNFLQSLENNGITTLQSTDALQAGQDKSMLEKISGTSTLRLAKRFTVDELRNRTTSSSGIVIKPVHGLQGIGVMLYENTDNDISRAYDYYTYLTSRNIETVIEERIEMLPARDPHTKKDVSWNIRTVISNGEHIGSYVRVGSINEPVNIARGAHAQSLDVFLSTYLSTDNSQQLNETIHDAIASVQAVLTNGIYGIDLTLDSEGRVCCFEINTGYVGGLQNIIQFENDDEKKLAYGENIVGSWTTSIEVSSDDRPRPYVALTLGEVTLRSLLITLQRCNIKTNIAFLEPQEISDRESNTDEIYGFLHYITLLREVSGVLPTELEEVGRQNLYCRYPVISSRYMPHFLTASAQTAHEQLACLSELTPHLQGDIFVSRAWLALVTHQINLRALGPLITAHVEPLTRDQTLHELAYYCRGLVRATFPDDQFTEAQLHGLSYLYYSYFTDKHLSLDVYTQEVESSTSDITKRQIVLVTLFLAINTGDYALALKLYREYGKVQNKADNADSLIQNLMSFPEFQSVEDRLFFIELLSQGDDALLGIYEYIQLFHKCHKEDVEAINVLHLDTLRQILVDSLFYGEGTDEEKIWMEQYINNLIHNKNALPIRTNSIDNDTFIIATIISYLVQGNYEAADSTVKEHYGNSPFSKHIQHTTQHFESLRHVTNSLQKDA
jgi:glutathione synthase/RimK-type ligase-like ATP-grasp enzyme